MASRISTTDLVTLQKKAVSLQAATRRAREKAGEITERLVSSGETGAAALGFGYLSGRAGEKPFEVAGVPIDLGSGIVALLLATMGIGRGMESHLTALGNGAIGCYLTKLGYKAGLKVTAASGPMKILQGEALSDETMADLAIALKKFQED